MNPQARAAADRLAAFLALPEYASNDIRVLGLCRTGQSHYDAPVTTGDLRLVLAALDRHEKARDPSTWREPCNVALSHTNGEITCQLAVSDPPPAGYLESGGRYTGNRNHWEKHWRQDEHGQVRTWTDNESEG